MEVANGTEAGTADLVERIGQVHQEDPEASCPNPGAQSREGAPGAVELRGEVDPPFPICGLSS